MTTKFLDLSGIPKGKYSCKALIFYFGLLLRTLGQTMLKSVRDAERSQPRGRKTVTGANVREQVGAKGREGGDEISKDLPST